MTPTRPSHLLAAVCALFILLPCAAQARGRKPAPAALPAIADFAKLAGARPSACSAPVDPALSSMDTPALRRCAWNGRVEMLYWRSIPAPPATCLPPAAIAWHRLAQAMRADAPPWNAAWSAKALNARAAATQQTAAVWRGADGQWSAVLWRWTPADNRATRDWQAGHWSDVTTAVQAIGAGDADPAASPLFVAWRDASRGKPRVVDGDAWRWVAEQSCLRLETAGVAQTRIHLPYSRDDARLEQRSGMQVQLARHYPTAEWLQPFTLLPPARPGDRTGAKFIAIWRDGRSVTGQLWMPLRDDAGIVRARIVSDLAPASPDRLQEQAKGRAGVIEHELTALAHAWEARNE